MTETCHICNGINPPHPMDEYHLFLQSIKIADEYLQMAKGYAKKLPSIQIQLNHTMDSISTLRKEAKII